MDRESFVRLDGSRYSVPPAHVGARVDVLQYDEKIVVRSNDLIIAEHARAAGPGQYVADQRHLRELWRLAMPQGSDQTLPKWHMTASSAITVRPLSVYEEAAL